MKRLNNKYYLVLSFVLALQACNKVAYTPVFYGQYCNPQRTSYRDVQGLKEPPNKVVWQYTLTKSDEIFFNTMSAPTIEENRVFMVSGNMISCVNLDTGKEVLEEKLSRSFSSLFRVCLFTGCLRKQINRC